MLVNPNEHWLDGGSVDDNGQTIGRKLVMDYYGTWVPIGGGAIYGKHRQHADRWATRQMRKLAPLEHGGGKRWGQRSCGDGCRASCWLMKSIIAR